MKSLIEWFKWLNYRRQVAKEMHKVLKSHWSYWQCLTYSKCFRYGYDQAIKNGDEINAYDDVEAELDCWRG